MSNVNQYIPLVTAAEVISNSFTNDDGDGKGDDEVGDMQVTEIEKE